MSKPETLTLNVPTYHETTGHVSPLVPVEVDLADGVILTLGKPTEEVDVPVVIVERRRNGWMISIASESGSDSNLLVYIMDDGEMEYVKDGLPSQHPVEMDMPPKRVDQMDASREGAKS